MTGFLIGWVRWFFELKHTGNMFEAAAKTIPVSMFLGGFICFIAGTILHFIFEWFRDK